MNYCNITTDITDYYPGIADFQNKKEIGSSWTIASGQTNTYQEEGTGQVNMVFENGVMLTIKTSIALVEAAASSFFYDSNIDVLYVHPINSDNPADYTYEIGEDWDALLTTFRAKAQKKVDEYLSSKFSVPLLPRIRKTHNTSDYDESIIEATVTYICYLLAERQMPGSDMSDYFFKKFDNPNPDAGEKKGIINKILDGDIFLQDQITPREAGGFNVIPGSTNDNNELLVFPIGGKHDVPYPVTWKIEITTGGAPGTALYRLSYDDGNSWDYTNQVTRDTANDYITVSLGGGLYAYFDPSTTYTTNDKWQIDIFPYNSNITAQSKFASVLTER